MLEVLMRNKLLFIFAAMSCITIFSVTSAMAFGIGIYADGAYNKFYASDQGHTAKLDDFGFIGGGLLLDTCVARNDLFNYRLGLGYQRDLKNYDLPTHKISMNNYLGFGIVRTAAVRWWAGPEIGARYYIIGNDRGTKNEVGGNIGLVTGLNFNVGDVFTVGIEGGFRYNLLFKDPIVHGPEGHGAISVLFRINDKYN
jgi:hypothetical protein